MSARVGHDGGEVRAALEDDYHHFRVVLQHRAGCIVHVEGVTLRHPYGLCPEAARRLPELLGMRMDPVASSVTRFTDATAQCTHLLDLAGLAMAAALRGHPRRQYDLEVPDRVAGRTQARLQRDGEDLLVWQIQRMEIVAPAPYAGVSMHQGLARWAIENLDAELAEAVIVLRRGAVIATGRRKPLDAMVHAEPNGRCYAHQPHRAAQALRVVGSTWDFTPRSNALCADDAGWLAWADDEAAAGNG